MAPPENNLYLTIKCNSKFKIKLLCQNIKDAYQNLCTCILERPGLETLNINLSTSIVGVNIKP